MKNLQKRNKRILSGTWISHKPSGCKVKVVKFQPLTKEYLKASLYLKDYNLPTRKEDYICVEKVVACECEDCGNRHKKINVSYYPISEFNL